MSSIRERLALGTLLVALAAISAPLASASEPAPPVKPKPMPSKPGPSKPAPKPKPKPKPKPPVKPTPAPPTKPAPAPPVKPTPAPPVKPTPAPPTKPTPPLPTAASKCTRERADFAMHLDLKSFGRLREQKPWRCIWSSDGCSRPMPPTWRPLFKDACVQHDFGYRNYGHGLMLGATEQVREWIDDRQRTQMKRICANTFSPLDSIGFGSCVTAAEVVWWAVHVGGSGAFFNG